MDLRILFKEFDSLKGCIFGARRKSRKLSTLSITNLPPRQISIRSFKRNSRQRMTLNALQEAYFTSREWGAWLLLTLMLSPTEKLGLCIAWFLPLTLAYTMDQALSSEVTALPHEIRTPPDVKRFHRFFPHSHIAYIARMFSSPSTDRRIGAFYVPLTIITWDSLGRAHTCKGPVTLVIRVQSILILGTAV